MNFRLLQRQIGLIRLPLFCIFLFIVSLLFFSCATLSGKYERREDWAVYEVGQSARINETQLENGCSYTKVEDFDFPVIFHLVTVPLKNVSKITCEPEKIYEDGFIKAQKTKKFSKRTDSYIAINATPYDKQRFPYGIYRENKKLYSAPVEKYASVTFYADETAKIYFNQTDEVFDSNDNSILTVGGFFPIIKDGKKYGKYIDNKDSRTALGISKDRKTVYILVVEGMDSQKSRGLNYSQASDILLSYGVWEALMFDGGDSTALCINKKNVLSYSFQRKVPVSLGFCIK